MKQNHKHKVNETHLRSILKAVTSRIIEIAVDTLLIGTIYAFLGIPNSYELASGIAISIEMLCALTSYINDRLWNKISWGREVKDIEEDNTNQVEHL